MPVEVEDMVVTRAGNKKKQKDYDNVPDFPLEDDEKSNKKSNKSKRKKKSEPKKVEKLKEKVLPPMSTLTPSTLPVATAPESTEIEEQENRAATSATSFDIKPVSVSAGPTPQPDEEMKEKKGYCTVL